MWSFYDKYCPKTFSFNDEYSFLNVKIRSKLQGGPCIAFHRHCEIKNVGNFDKSVYCVPNGNRYQRLVSYDFNALYAYSMKQDLPTGLPFYYRRQKDNTFKMEIAGSSSGWSLECLDWLNFMSFDPRFLIQNGKGFHQMFSAVTGEPSVTVGNHVYTVDGMVRTDQCIYYLEYLGCRKRDIFYILFTSILQ